MSEELFLLIDNEEYSGVVTEVQEFKSLEMLNAQLNIDSFNNLDDELKILHGKKVNARFIPNSFNGCTPYIYIRNPLEKTKSLFTDEAHIEKVTGDPEVVTLTIEELLKEKTYKFNCLETKVTIDDVYLFFGHELSKVLYVPQENIDEELLDRVNKLTESISNESKKLDEGNYEMQS